MFEWLNGANLVVSMHDGNKDCARAQRPADIVRIDASKAINLQIRHRCTEAFEEPARIYHCRVFHLGGNNMGIRSSACEEHTFESVIVGLTPTTREDDFICFAAEQPGNLHSSFVDRLSRWAAGPVAARRIAVWLLEDIPHRID